VREKARRGHRKS